eukprot:CAMPEP_0172515972 /NCGR_PEP_ID=MMETSP1066-20121228/272327_1 /TAXON_ID=671091 /ORGANISM="Coscinodiscus wailesii, Strain CCMP2513" /LENGTH=167 /DNA_ID=CAMNT_0013297259 /DNA_START=38 /DNA_END=541 /DNA_ORIENTATION=+
MRLHFVACLQLALVFISGAVGAFAPMTSIGGQSAASKFGTYRAESPMRFRIVSPADGRNLIGSIGIRSLYSSSATTTALHVKYWDDMQRRGRYFLGFVLLTTVWLFSVPPEFRRAVICTQEGEPNCVTARDWSSGIAEYYRNGGGIQFDFSIDPATLARNGFLNSSD